MDLTPLERELLKSVDRLIAQSNKSAKATRLSGNETTSQSEEELELLMGCVKLLAESQSRLIEWCLASAQEAAADGSATIALKEVQMRLAAALTPP